MAAETVIRRAEALLRAALCCAEGLRGVAALLLTAESGLRAGLGPCVPGSEWQAALCVR